MPDLLLIRHSVPQIDPSVPASQWHLSEEGLLRARALAEKVAASGSPPDVIVSSIEPKAVETARVLAEVLGLPFTTATGLHEHERPLQAFVSREQFESLVSAFFASPARLVFGRETADQAHARFARAVRDVAAAHPDQAVGIVTHGTVMSLFVSRLRCIDPFSFWKSLSLPDLITLPLPLDSEI